MSPQAKGAPTEKQCLEQIRLILCMTPEKWWKKHHQCGKKSTFKKSPLMVFAGRLLWGNKLTRILHLEFLLQQQTYVVPVTERSGTYALFLFIFWLPCLSRHLVGQLQKKTFRRFAKNNSLFQEVHGKHRP